MKKKVLCVGSGSFISRGVETYLLSLYSELDHNRFDMDFLTPNLCENKDFFQKTNEFGNKVIELRIRKRKIFYLKYLIGLYNYLEHNRYDILYINTGNIVAMSTAIIAGKISGVDSIIVHSHNAGLSSFKHIMIKTICSPIISFFPSKYAACSNEAKKYVFPKNCWEKSIFIPYAVCLNNYEYNEKCRINIRKEYKIDDYFIIGHIGAFIDQKNHDFLLKIFCDVCNRDDSFRLVLIGDGEKERVTYIKNLIYQYNLQDKVLLVGRTDKIAEWLSAFDMFVLPSKFEGLPICSVEAQKSGLPCILSDTITKEAKLTKNVMYLPINNGTDEWVDAIMKFKEKKRNIDMSDELVQFDSKSVAQTVESKLFEI